MRMYFPGLSRPLIACGMILLTWLINWIGIMASARFQVITVIQLITGIILIIVPAVISGGNPDFSQPLPAGNSGFMQACVMAMLTYTGFNIIGEMGDEIENPRRNVPLTIALGLGIVIILYVGMGWVIAGTLSVAEMKTTKVAALDTAMRYLPKWTAHYINLAAFAAAITSVNAVFLAAPRELLALSGEKMMPQWLVKYNEKRQNFPIAMAVISLAGCGLTFINLEPDVWGMFCVAGLMATNLIISVGAFRLFSIFPDHIKTSPFPIRKWWLFPSAVLSALFSLAFTGMAMFFYRPVPYVWPVAYVCLILIMAVLFLAYRTRASASSSQEI
jgi:amino acid transporter